MRPRPGMPPRRLSAPAALLTAILTAVAGANPVLAGGVVAAESPLATAEGVAVLAAGGSPVDAAITTAFAVCVVNPSSCGIGGGGFLVVWDPATRSAHALDYREVAPARTEERLYERDGTYDAAKSRRGALAIAVPGEVRGLFEAHRRFGRLPWSRLVEPAVRLARDGFPVGAHLARQIAKEVDALSLDPELRAVFLDANGGPLPAGAPLRAPALAATLQAIADGGPEAFYGGPVARAIAEEVRLRGGVLDEGDLAAYRPVWRRPLETVYRGADIYTMPPPSGGGPALILALRTLSRYDVAALGFDSPTRMHLFAEVLKHASADRVRSAGDPVSGARAAAPGAVSPGKISATRTFPSEYYAPTTANRDDGGTSHVSVISEDGGAVACTTTINTGFGAFVGVTGTGIALNNEIDDFSFDAPNLFGLAPGRANRIGPGKRPASSMTPTLAVEAGRAVVAVGASGGPLIVSATLEVLSNVLDFDLPPEAAVAAPRIHHQWQPDVLLVEAPVRAIDRTVLERLGHQLREIPAVAAVSLATALPGQPVAGAGDPRKGGAASIVPSPATQDSGAGSPTAPPRGPHAG